VDFGTAIIAILCVDFGTAIIAIYSVIGFYNPD
jgi:hypothetical protein